MKYSVSIYSIPDYAMSLIYLFRGNIPLFRVHKFSVFFQTENLAQADELTKENNQKLLV